MADIFTELIKQSRVDFQQLMKNAWLKERKKALDYEAGRTKDCTLGHILSKQAQKEVPIENNNITKRIIDRISLVYMVAPTRTYGKNEKASLPESYETAIKFKDEQLRVAEKRLNLLNLIFLKPTLRRKDENSPWIYDYEWIWDFEPGFTNDPLNPFSISYPLATKMAVTDLEPELWAYWDNDFHIIFNGKTNVPIVQEDNPENINPYGTLPGIFIFTEKPQSGFLDVDPANDIIDANESINVIGTAGNANVFYQSFGYIVATGLNDDKPIELAVGPDKILGLGRDTSIQVLAPPDTITSIDGNINQKYKMIANNYHLPQGFVQADATQAESGIALKIRSMELQDERSSDIVRWRNVEEALYEKEKIISEVDLSVVIPDVMQVDFTETEEKLTPDEQRAKDDWDLAHGLTTEAEILMRRDPDKYQTVEEAQEKIDGNRQDKREGVTAGTPISPIEKALNEAQIEEEV